MDLTSYRLLRGGQRPIASEPLKAIGDLLNAVLGDVGVSSVQVPDRPASRLRIEVTT